MDTFQIATIAVSNSRGIFLWNIRFLASLNAYWSNPRQTGQSKGLYMKKLTLHSLVFMSMLCTLPIAAEEQENSWNWKRPANYLLQVGKIGLGCWMVSVAYKNKNEANTLNNYRKKIAVIQNNFSNNSTSNDMKTKPRWSLVIAPLWMIESNVLHLLKIAMINHHPLQNQIHRLFVLNRFLNMNSIVSIPT